MQKFINTETIKKAGTIILKALSFILPVIVSVIDKKKQDEETKKYLDSAVAEFFAKKVETE